MTDLFPIEESLSPRLRWMRRHGVTTEHVTDSPLGPHWWADAKGSIGVIHDTEEEALVAWAKMNFVPLWNEEGGLS